MPGPVSDSYDPEFGTGERADIVLSAIGEVRDRISSIIRTMGDEDELKDIVALAGDKRMCPRLTTQRGGNRFTERELRIIRFAIRFALNRELESL